VGSLAAVIGVLTVNLIIAGMSIVPAIAIGVAVACAFGALQGFVIAATGINSLVFTIGTLIGLRGFALIISNENSVTIPIPRLDEKDFLGQRVLGLLSPLSILMFAVFSSRTCSPLHRVGTRDLRHRRGPGGGPSRRRVHHPSHGDFLCAFRDAGWSGGSRFVGSTWQCDAVGI
jgi:ABC-type xylose transport system permease subunit